MWQLISSSRLFGTCFYIIYKHAIHKTIHIYMDISTQTWVYLMLYKHMVHDECLSGLNFSISNHYCASTFYASLNPFCIQSENCNFHNNIGHFRVLLLHAALTDSSTCIDNCSIYTNIWHHCVPFEHAALNTSWS